MRALSGPHWTSRGNVPDCPLSRRYCKNLLRGISVGKCILHKQCKIRRQYSNKVCFRCRSILCTRKMLNFFFYKTTDYNGKVGACEILLIITIQDLVQSWSNQSGIPSVLTPNYNHFFSRIPNSVCPYLWIDLWLFLHKKSPLYEL